MQAFYLISNGVFNIHSILPPHPSKNHKNKITHFFLAYIQWGPLHP